MEKSGVFQQWIEALDSALFGIPELVDYRVTWDGKLTIEVYGKLPSQEPILKAVKKLYPQLEVLVSMASIGKEQRPAYLGKRHIILKDIT